MCGNAPGNVLGKWVLCLQRAIMDDMSIIKMLSTPNAGPGKGVDADFSISNSYFFIDLGFLIGGTPNHYCYVLDALYHQYIFEHALDEQN